MRSAESAASGIKAELEQRLSGLEASLAKNGKLLSGTSLGAIRQGLVTLEPELLSYLAERFALKVLPSG